MLRSELGSLLHPGGPNRNFGTWNARALFIRRLASEMGDKCNFLLLLCAGVALLAVQETHGDLSDAMEFATRLPNHFVGWSSRAHSAVFDSENSSHLLASPLT